MNHTNEAGELRGKIIELLPYALDEHNGPIADKIMHLIEAQRAAAYREGQIAAAEHVKQICPITDGWTIERLHNRIDTYLSQLQAPPEQKEQA